MVEERIIAMEAAKKGIEVSEQEIDALPAGPVWVFPQRNTHRSSDPVILSTPTFSPTQELRS